MGIAVVMESKAGEGASYSDRDYSEAGAKIAKSKKEVFECDILVKSAPVGDDELDFLKPTSVYYFPNSSNCYEASYSC